jgi:hypothetical protein
MLTALPPEMPVATEGDRPIVVGQVHELDFYLQAHEAKNRGYHDRAVVLLTLAGLTFGIDLVRTGNSRFDWDNNLEAVDRAWSAYWEARNA